MNFNTVHIFGFLSAVAFTTNVVAEEGGSSDAGIEEIVVTATYRETNLMETPQSISVIGEEMIENLGATDMKSLFQFIPGLNMAQGASGGSGSGSNRYIIRGVESQQGTLSYEPSFSGVAVFADAVSMTSAQGPARQVGGQLFDTARVEVLKGPQGTLFGEGSVGGSIRFISNDPQTDAFDFKVKASLSDMSHADDLSHRVDVMVNIPITESFAIRITAFDTETAGYIDRSSQGRKDTNEDNSSGAKISAKWQATDKLTFKAWWNHVEADSDGSLHAQVPFDESINITLPGTKAESFDDMDVFSLEFEYDLGFATLFSASSYFDRETVSRSETTQFVATIFDVFIGGILVSQMPELATGPDPLIPGTNLTHFQRDDTADTERLTQEFRLVSNGEGSLQWTAGIFYKTSDDLRNNFQPIGFSKPQFADLFTTFFNDPSNNRDDKLQDMSVFGEVSYEISDQWEVTGGARVTRLDQDFERTERGTDDTFFAPSFKVAYRPTNSSMFYFNVGTGFRPGNANFGQEFNERQFRAAKDNVIPGVNPQGLTGNQAADLVAPLIFYDGDEVVNYEFGAKLRFLDNRAQLIAAVYFFDWEDIIQRFQDTNIPNINNFFSQNAGDAHTQGLEVEFNYLLTDNLRLRFAGDINEAELDDGTNQAGVDDGNSLTFAPEWSGTLGIDYTFNITSTLGANISINHQRIGSAYQDAANNIRLPQQELTNLRISLMNRAADNWRVTLFASNLTDEDTILRNDTFIGQAFFVFQQPRVVGLEFSYHPG